MTSYRTSITDAHVEKMARAMILIAGGEPDLMVYVGEPQMFGTPMGAVSVPPAGEPVAMWTLYTGSARKALEIAQGIVEDQFGAVTFNSASEPVAVSMVKPEVAA